MKNTFGKALFLAMVSLAVLATSCTTTPQGFDYEHASTTTVQKALDDNLGGIYENGDTGTYDICQRVPIRYPNCTGDTVNGFRHDTRDTSVALLGDHVTAEELMNALGSRNMFLMHAVDKLHVRSPLSAWIGNLPLMHFFWLLLIAILAVLGLLWLAAMIRRSVSRPHTPTPPAASQPPVPVNYRTSVTYVPEEADEFEAEYENGDTRMSIWIKGPRPEAFVLSYQKGKNEPKTLSFQSKDEEEDAPPA